MNDNKIDDVLGELKAALDVEPRHGFESRIRARVAEGSAAPSRAWLWAVAGVLVAATIVIVVMWQPTSPVELQRSLTAEGPAPSTPAQDPVISQRERPVSGSGYSRSVATETHAIRIRSERARDRLKPIVSPADARAMDRLVLGIAAGQVAVPPEAVLLDVAGPSADLEPIEIPPLEIDTNDAPSTGAEEEIR